MNSSFPCLVINRLSNSIINNTSTARERRGISFDETKIKNSFNKIQNFDKKSNIEDSTFTRLINSDAKMELIEINDTIIYSEHQNAFNNFLRCFNTVFENCNVKNNNGGAILSGVPLEIMNCIFEVCSASIGGTIYCTNQISVKKSYFEHALASKCALIFNKGNKNLRFDDSCFGKAEARSETFIIFEGDSIEINNCNTTSFVTMTSGIVAAKAKDVKMNSLAIINVFSDSFCGIKLCGDQSIFSMEKCVLTDIVSSSSSNEKCSIIELRRTKNEISKSYFSRISLGNSPYFSLDDSSVVFLNECCFDANSPLLAESEIIKDRCSFGCSKLLEIIFDSPNLRNPKKTKIVVEKKVSISKFSIIVQFLVFFAGILVTCTLLILREEMNRSKHSMKNN